MLLRLLLHVLLYLIKILAGSDGGVSYNIGALYGAGFFVCAMVICLTIICNIYIYQNI